MTQIDFYFNAENRLRLACSLSAKALEKGLRVLVLTADEETSRKLDTLLWSTPPTAFLPHCRARDEVAPLTPVIVDHEPGEIGHDQVLLNLSGARPSFFSRFQRLIEVVTTDETDRHQARERFRYYRDRGYDIRSHDLGRREK